MLKAILFDLDGTLLPMAMERFTEGYFSLLAKKAAPAGYESGKLVQTIWRGTKAMVCNDGAMTNEARFWHVFASVYGEEALKDKALFNDFYQNEFQEAAAYAQPQPELARKALAAARQRAGKVILATNPLFPACGVETRLHWIGLSASDFDGVTTYENSSFCKPDPRYYQAILHKLGITPSEALMVGNDMEEDVAAAESAGIKPYLVRDCVINPKGAAIACPSCSLGELADRLLQLP